MISFQIHDHLEIQKLLLKKMEKVPSILYTADVQRKPLWSEKIEKDIGSWRIHKS